MRMIDDIEEELCGGSAALSSLEVGRLSKEWAVAIASVVGTDPATFKAPLDKTYVRKLLPFVRRLNARLDYTRARAVFGELSETLEAQMALATYLDRAGVGNQPNGVAILFGNKGLFEQGWINDYLGLIDYLKQPVTAASLAAFLRSQNGRFPEGQAELFHQAFWSLTFRERALLLGAILGDMRFGGFKKAFHALEGHDIIGDFLPLDAGPNSAFEIGKTIVKAAVWTAPHDLGAEVITAMLGSVYEDKLDQQSSHPRASDDATRFGYRLGRFMNDLGPGPAKVAQYGHSQPTANDAWMAGLAHSKTEAGRARRVDFLRRVDTTVTEDVKRHLLRIKAYKGTGAWIETYGVELDPAYRLNEPLYRDGAGDLDLVLSLLKPNAKSEGLRFIDYLLQLGQLTKRTSVAAQKSVAPLLDIVEQGRRMVEQETDLTHSVPQEKLAADYFDRLRLRVGDTHFKFYTQGVFDFATQFRISLEVRGPHFNQMSAVTEPDRLFKRKAAIAMFVAAANMCLSGRPFNHDIHGDNEGMHLVGGSVRVGMFDNGALDVQRPTTAQKTLLADCLFNALVNAARNKYAPPSSLKHTIAKTRDVIGADRQSELNYANAVLRAALSIGDYTRHMLKRDYLVAGVAILKAGDLDREIMARLRHRTKALMSILFLPGRLSKKFAFEREQRSQFYPRNPKSRKVQQTPHTSGVPEKHPAGHMRPPGGWLSVRFRVDKGLL